MDVDCSVLDLFSGMDTGHVQMIIQSLRGKPDVEDVSSLQSLFASPSTVCFVPSVLKELNKSQKGKIEKAIQAKLDSLKSDIPFECKMFVGDGKARIIVHFGLSDPDTDDTDEIPYVDVTIGKRKDIDEIVQHFFSGFQKSSGNADGDECKGT